MVKALGFFLGGTEVKNLLANAEDAEMWVQSPGRKDPLEEAMPAPCSILAWRIPQTAEAGQWAAVHGVTKNWIQLSLHTKSMGQRRAEIIIF